MATDNRTNALSILTNTEKDKLREIHGGLIDEIAKKALSQNYKAKNYSGSIDAGSVEFARFVNAVSKEYGTARAAAKGEALNNKGKVRVNLDTNKEIVEEVNKNDLNTIGIPGLLAKRTVSHASTMVRELDRAFFNEAEKAGKVVTLKATKIEEKLEELVQALEVVKNEYVDGVDREDMVLFLNPKTYGEVRNYIDQTQNASVNGAVEELNLFHGVEVKSNVRQKEDAILMVKGSIAQPVNVFDYDAERIPMSNEVALELFYIYGVKAITPDLIFKAKFETTTTTEGK